MQKKDYSLLGLSLDYETAQYYIRYALVGLQKSEESGSSGFLAGTMGFIGDAFNYDSTTGVNFGSSYSGGWDISGGGNESFGGFGGGNFGGGGAGGSW